ncbi:NAD(P)/FAD-dependent oxidoreductase [Streptomyces chrestomyceticus]|uniref:NAD(P)/FAD-dependent oxidoreductase n=1 Tax=Streptomyces chrestomyceticus TaxID=68185 RepID=UPI0037AB79F1
MSTTRVHVLVIGGGPAGAAAAATAAAAGATVALVERGRPHRPKACGDALLGEAVTAIGSLGVDLARPDTLRPRTFRLTSPTGYTRSGQVPGGCLVIARDVLDQLLRDRAAAQGADVRYRTMAVTIRRHRPSGLTVETLVRARTREWIHADAVILAHGSSSRLSTTYDIDGAAIRAPALTCYRQDSGCDDLEFAFTAPLAPGYRWRFPATGDRSNVGVIQLPLAGTLPRAHLASRHRPAGPAGEPWRGGHAPLWTGKGQRWHTTDGILACGDAAGLVDPLTAEGIGSAVVSGTQAGLAAASYALDRARSLADYSDWVADWGAARYRPAKWRDSWQKFTVDAAPEEPSGRHPSTTSLPGRP